MDLTLDIEEYKLNTRAGGVIIHNNKILTHKNINKNHYCLPGGRVAIGESSEETIKREIKEELGKDIEITGYIATIENFFEIDNKKYHEIYFLHKIEFKNEEDKNIEYTMHNEEGKEYLRYEWIDLDKIEEYNILPICLKDILKSTKFPVHKINNDLKHKNIVIRKVKYEDIEQIVNININDWKKVYKGIIDDITLDNLNRNEKIEKWRKHYNIGNVIVAEEHGKVLGYCRYDDNAVYENSDIDSEIIAIYIDYDNLGKGIGRKLVEYVMNDLKNKNKTKMVIWCLEKNENGRKFYEKIGGKLIPDEKYFEKDGKRYKEVGYIYNIK